MWILSQTWTRSNDCRRSNSGLSHFSVNMVILFRLNVQMRERRQYKTRTFGDFYHSYIVIQLYSFISFPYSSIMQILRAQSQQQRHFEEMQIFKFEIFLFDDSIIINWKNADMRSSGVISMALCGTQQVATSHTVYFIEEILWFQKRFEQLSFAFKIQGLGNETVSWTVAVFFCSTQYSPFVVQYLGGGREKS